MNEKSIDKNRAVSSDYIKDQRRQYFLYTINFRALPSLSDGLKPAQRRVLWTGRNGEKTKTATLAGATMPIHPHASPDDVISNMAGPWCNNVPLFTGIGAFGTMLAPNSYGASRYTSVKVSDFTKDVVFADIEIIPMQPNYDDTLEEPKHFLPLIPIVLLNPTFGIAGGFQCNILPFDLRDIIENQIRFLEKKEVKETLPYFKPLDCRASPDIIVDTKTGNKKYTFNGGYQQINASEIRITKIPYGMEHTKFTDHLAKLEEEYKIVGFDDLSKDSINIVVKFSRGFVNRTTQQEMIKLLKLFNTETDNMNVISLNDDSVCSTNFVDVIEQFTFWRFGFYYKRYERLAKLLEKDIQKLKDVILAIEKNVGGIAVKTKSKGELEDYLEYIGIVNLEYISSLPVYRFTEDEKQKTQKRIDDALEQQKYYLDLLSDEGKRTKIYISELKEILKKYG
jgi:DNA gyrase/topoisomerase IV subunit A